MVMSAEKRKQLNDAIARYNEERKKERLEKVKNIKEKQPAKTISKPVTKEVPETILKTPEKSQAEIIAEQTAIRAGLGMAASPYKITEDVKYEVKKPTPEKPISDIRVDTKKKSSAFQRNIVQPVAAGIREGGLFGGVAKNEYLPSGERQFETPTQKGLYNVAKTTAYVVDVGSIGLFGKGLEAAATSKKAYETARAGKTYEGFYKAAQVGKPGGKVNIAAKTIAATAPSLVIGTTTYKVGEKATYLRRTVGLDMKKQPAEALEREKEIARKSGLIAGTLSSNVVSQAAGSVYVGSDTLKKRAALTALERGKNIAAAGFGEGATITYLTQESKGGKAIFFDTKSKLVRTGEVAVGGLIGGLSAATIDYAIEVPKKFAAKTTIKPIKYGARAVSGAVESAAYGTDPFEMPGDVIESSLRGGESYNIRPVRISTKTDFTFKRFSFGTKIKTTPSTTVKSSINLPVRTSTDVTLRENNLLREMQTSTAVSTRATTAVNTRTMIPVTPKTKIPSIVPTKTLLPVGTKTLVPETIKINTPVGTKTPIDPRTTLDVPVNVPVITTPVPPLFSLRKPETYRRPMLQGFRQPKRYSPSLIGIEKGVRATKTSGLSGFEIRGIQNPIKKEKSPRMIDFGSFKVQPVKSGVGMKFKILKQPNKNMLRLKRAIGI